ncbi:MAG TPA: IMP cyclohydrolase [Spirochaetota bacterium]|nr:IMP cyclohydrolase [Spirochaetota bacterium]HOM39112.1 IMP cyclohydrolase [Spirochaetota bacterium]HPQ49995.1 IMP cyclohydrolase [Spirochaetota bacterium]
MSKKALISVSDKTGIVKLAKALVKAGYQIISTGGTAKILKSNGIEVIMIEDYTGFPEILDGRVKTLQPKIHGGILADRIKHLEEIKKMGIETIDIVVVNLYPFAEVISKEATKLEEAIENIDIGGIALLRASAKNFKYITVITDPADYDIIEEKLLKGEIDYKTRLKLAIKAFKTSSEYDNLIYKYLEKVQ